MLAIPVKRTEKKIVQGLSRAEVEALLATPDLTMWQGRRDHALLLTLYNTGARVSEMITLQRHQVHFGVSTFVHLHGKGRKERAVPLWHKTARALQGWFRDLAGASHQLTFLMHGVMPCPVMESITCCSKRSVVRCRSVLR